MKKLYGFPLIIIFSMILISCDDEVNPKADFKEVYALNCILRGDTTYQIATITRSYDVEGFDPSSNEADPFIPDARIKLKYFNGNDIYYFKDTLINRSPDDKYKTPIHFYYLNNFRPSDNSKISIEAVLPNGNVLKAESEAFYVTPFLVTSNAPEFPTGVEGGNLSFDWSGLSEGYKSINLYYAPELIINYSRIVSNKRIKYQRKVPLFYLNSSNGSIPYYPSIQANTTTITFGQSIIEKSLLEISEGDPVKENYIIEKAVFRLMILDKNLAVYYSSQKTFKDEFSVRVTQPEFTNVSGGLGIFGSYNTVQIDIPIREDYLNLFGYRIH
jgi:hypothetical protein